MADFQIEREIIKKGFKSIAGVDEVGRGALFGPVVSSAVIFPDTAIRQDLSGWIEEINDSKLLSPNKRKRLAKAILTNAVSVGIGLSTNSEIDQKNVFWASINAMRRAVENLSITPKGDKKCISIAAASIVAKVLRDDMMIHLDRVYNGYALSKNKGYGTKEHYRALTKLGPTLFHRRTFNLKHN